jgi:hypothetical protein
VDERLDRLAWRRQAQVWLLVERPPAPSASQLMPPIWIPTEVAPKLFEARAIFELP